MDDSFTTVYAIARRLSKVNAQQFVRFCHRIGAEISDAPEVADLFDESTVEASFVVNECAFDAGRLADLVSAQVAEAGVDVLLDTRANKVRADSEKSVVVECSGGGDSFELNARTVFNCTYSAANHLLEASGYPHVSLKHELTEIALVEVPAGFQNLGITVMDGPFFSVMPFPPSGGHSMTHVRYTPHATWSDRPGDPADPETLSARESSGKRLRAYAPRRRALRSGPVRSANTASHSGRSRPCSPRVSTMTAGRFSFIAVPVLEDSGLSLARRSTAHTTFRTACSS